MRGAQPLVAANQQRKTVFLRGTDLGNVPALKGT